jgi:hypothetical protein
MLLEIISLVLNALLGGGLIVTVVTLKSARKKANEEAKSAALTNMENAADILMESIVEPLRQDLKTNTNEVRKLRKAIEKGYECEYHVACPILHELQREEDNNDDSQSPTKRNKRQRAGTRNVGNDLRTGSGDAGGAEN